MLMSICPGPNITKFSGHQELSQPVKASLSQSEEVFYRSHTYNNVSSHFLKIIFVVYKWLKLKPRSEFLTQGQHNFKPVYFAFGLTNCTLTMLFF